MTKLQTILIALVAFVSSIVGGVTTNAFGPPRHGTLVETAKSKADVYTELADNTSGAITPERIRNALESGSQYGHLCVNGGSTAQTGIGTTAIKFTPYTFVGPNNGLVPETTGDTITLPNFAATYHIVFTVAFSGTVNTLFTFTATDAGTSLNGCATERLIGTGGDVGSTSFTCFYDAAGGEVLSIYVEADGASKTVTATYSGFDVNRIDL